VKSTKLAGVLVGVLAGIAAMLMLLVACPVKADQTSIGGVWVDGHSWDGAYGVNNKGGQSYGMRFSYEKDGYEKQLSKNNTFGIDYGVMLAWYRVTITDNQNGRDDYQIKHTNSLLAGVYPNFHIESYKKVRFILAPMAGAEFADDGESAPFLGGMVGIQYNWTPSFATSILQEEIFTLNRRYDSTSFNVIFRF
jgi:hypothetical protein